MNDQSPATGGVRSVAEVRTPNAGRYLQQLCKHFGHRVPVDFDTGTGRVSFAVGDCVMEAGEDALKFSLAAPDTSRMDELQDVVARHLLRFAFREELRVDWRTA